jgi:AcrR family transcriptional regulator
MPKIVDHDRQRACFAEAVIRLVAREGFEGMNMRAVAAEAGLSYGSLFHYFESKDELLLQAVRHFTEQQTQRVNAYSSRFKGLKALRHLLFDDALVSDADRDIAVVWMAFLYKASLQERFADMHVDLIDGWLNRIRQMLEDAQSSGEIAAGVDTELEAIAIFTFSAGIGQQGLLHPRMLPVRRQKQLIDKYLEKLCQSTAVE